MALEDGWVETLKAPRSEKCRQTNVVVVKDSLQLLVKFGSKVPNIFDTADAAF